MRKIQAEILLASYQGAQYIRAQIDSILGQTDDCWHLTVSDDGSTDGTVEIVDEYVRMYPDRITRICSGIRFGNARDHFFWLIRQCKSAYMLTCDQDDVWYPEKIEKIMQAMLSQKMPLSKLAEPVRMYPQVLKNVEVTDKATVLNDEGIKAAVAQAEADLAGDGRVLLRASGTEPVLRVMSEATEDALAEKAVDFIIDEMKKRDFVVKVR